jgi:hypothetical protein
VGDVPPRKSENLYGAPGCGRGSIQRSGLSVRSP